MWAGEALRAATTPTQGDSAQAPGGGRSGTSLTVRSPRSFSRFPAKSQVSTVTRPRPPPFPGFRRSFFGPALLGSLTLNRWLARAGPSDWIPGEGSGPQGSFWDLIGQLELSPIPRFSGAQKGRQPHPGRAPSSTGRRRGGCLTGVRSLR